MLFRSATLSLLGMGFDAVSAAPNFLPELRFVIRNTTLAQARQLAEDLRGLRTSREVHLRLSAERRRLHRAVGIQES